MATRVLTPDQCGHSIVLERAMEIYLDRDRIRGDMWRTRPPSHKIEMIREKLDRVERGLSLVDETVVKNAVLDDATDIINFAVFLVREIEEGILG